jgi:hypothetical protein
LIRDAEVIESARQEVQALLAQDPQLAQPEHQALADLYRRLYGERERRALSG